MTKRGEVAASKWEGIGDWGLGGEFRGKKSGGVVWDRIAMARRG